MNYLPVIIALVIAVIAYGLYFNLPKAYDGDNGFLWVIAAFIMLYIAGAVYVTYAMPLPV